MGVTEILCCFRLVLERKTSKEIVKISLLELLEKFLANNFALSDSEEAPPGHWGMADLPLLRTRLG